MQRIPTDEHLQRLMPDGIPKWIRCYDNGGKSFDRYTVVFTKKRNANISDGGEFIHLGMNVCPSHPQGFGQHGYSDWPIDRPAYSHLGKPIKFEELSQDCQKLVISTYKLLWRLEPELIDF